MDEDLNVGGWNINIAVGYYPQKVASYGLQSLQSLTGASYQPIAYLGSQVVNGINHAILVEATSATANPVTTLRVVKLHEQPVDETHSNFSVMEIGDPIITYGSGRSGGLSTPESIVQTADDAAELLEKSGLLQGVGYSPKSVLATQVVAGLNSAVLAEATPLSQPSKKVPVIMYFWTQVDENHTVVLTDIEVIEI